MKAVGLSIITVRLEPKGEIKTGIHHALPKANSSLDFRLFRPYRTNLLGRICFITNIDPYGIVYSKGHPNSFGE